MHRDDECESNPIQGELDNEEDDVVTESLDYENGENEAEITVLEEEITPDTKDLFGECRRTANFGHITTFVCSGR